MGSNTTPADIQQHKKRYATFDAERLLMWLNEKPERWKQYQTPAQANYARKLLFLKANHSKKAESCKTNKTLE